MENGNGENKVRKILLGEVSFLIAIIGAVVSITLFITRPDAEMRQDIALTRQAVEMIQKNELQHITTREEQQKQITQILQEIAAVKALLEQHLKE